MLNVKESVGSGQNIFVKKTGLFELERVGRVGDLFELERLGGVGDLSLVLVCMNDLGCISV